MLAGIYKVPITVVAEALFDALVEFGGTRQRASYLNEIHIVDVNISNINSLEQLLSNKLHEIDHK